MLISGPMKQIYLIEQIQEFGPNHLSNQQRIRSDIQSSLLTEVDLNKYMKRAIIESIELIHKKHW